MIFVTVGTQKFQFDRLLKAVDRLIEDDKINEDVFAQTGYSNYKPKNYKYKNFLNRDEFSKIMSQCDKVITHGGTGSIIQAVKKEKLVIAIPRLSKYKEHVDNHQCQIVKQFLELGLIETTSEVDNLNDLLMKIKYKKYNKYNSNTELIINSIEEFIDSL